MAQKPSLSLTSNDHNSEWASAYLSHWIEECDTRGPQLGRRSSFGDGSHHRHHHRHDQMRRHCSHDSSQQSSSWCVNNGSHLVSPVSRKSVPSDCITMVLGQSTAGAAHRGAAYNYDRPSLSKRVHFHKGEGSTTFPPQKTLVPVTITRSYPKVAFPNCLSIRNRLIWEILHLHKI